MDEKDRIKFDVAVKLGKRIGEIRNRYREYWRSTEARLQQLGIALYFIDTFLFRTGDPTTEPEDKETVGCCSLRRKHILDLDPESNMIKFKFQSKGHQPYTNEANIEPEAVGVLQRILENKEPSDRIFDCISPREINQVLKEFDQDFSAKVFRTYGATDLMHKYLKEKTKPDYSDEEKIEKINIFKEGCLKAAKLCNHLEKNRKIANKTKKLQNKKVKASKNTHSFFQNFIKRDIRNMNTNIRQLEAEAEHKKTSVSTTKKYYIDPRIVVQWCMEHNIQIDQVYSAELQKQFKWAIGDLINNQPGPSGEFSGTTTNMSDTE